MNNYTITNDNIYMQHATRSPIWLVQDSDTDDSQYMEIDAAVASQDYFETLATTLDGLESEHPELHQIILDLLYLQRYYKIIKK